MDSQLIYNTIQCAKQLNCCVEITSNNKKITGWVVNDPFERVVLQNKAGLWPSQEEEFPKFSYADIQHIKLIRE
jgi:hypothetical protein